jgi:diketogulonate reductase-like aldo/keto reductase
MTRPLLTLNNGVQMPALGLGDYQSGAPETQAAVEAALSGGYRMIDTPPKSCGNSSTSL